MKMNFGNVQVRVEMRKRSNKKTTAAQRAYMKNKAIEHYDKNKEKVITDYFFIL